MSKTVIIVGATSGIGRKMAEIYLAKGYRVGITGRRAWLLEELKAKYPEQVETGCFDVTGTENILQLDALVKKLGRLDVLVISAGIGEPSRELDWEIEKKTVSTNVQGFIEIATWAYNFFAEQNHGSLAVISSIAANRGNSWAPAYSASKAFQSIYFECLQIKTASLRINISITCVEPGFVNTKMAKSNKQFWVVPVEKAARQIVHAIDKKKRKAYISHRWQLIAFLIRWMPFWLYKRFV
jgi:short-subunit dehydrogenase